MKLILQHNLRTVRNTGRTLFEFDSDKHNLFFCLSKDLKLIEVMDRRANPKAEPLFRCDALDASVWADNCRTLGQYLAAGCTRFPG